MHVGISKYRTLQVLILNRCSWMNGGNAYTFFLSKETTHLQKYLLAKLVKSKSMKEYFHQCIFKGPNMKILTGSICWFQLHDDTWHVLQVTGSWRKYDCWSCELVIRVDQENLQPVKDQSQTREDNTCPRCLDCITYSWWVLGVMSHPIPQTQIAQSLGL